MSAAPVAASVGVRGWHGALSVAQMSVYRRTHMLVLPVVLAVVVLVRVPVDFLWVVVDRRAVMALSDRRMIVVVPDRRMIMVVMVAVCPDDHAGHANPYVYVYIGLGRGGEQPRRESQPEHQQFLHNKPLFLGHMPHCDR